MLVRELHLPNKLGLHARPASKLVSIAAAGKSNVFITFNGQRVKASSILGLMQLQAEQGALITVEVDGEDEQEVMARIVELIHNKFYDDQ